MKDNRILYGILSVVALMLLTALFSGCGYALVGRTSTLPEDVRNIYVEALKNTTRRSQLEQVLARAIADEFVTRRRFEVVSDRSQADGVLSGTVTSFSIRPVVFDENARATEYEIVIGAATGTLSDVVGLVRVGHQAPNQRPQPLRVLGQVVPREERIVGHGRLASDFFPPHLAVTGSGAP